MRPSPASLAMSKPWPIVDVVKFRILAGAISTSLLPSRLIACLRLDQLVFGHIVHPAQVRGNEHIGRRALLDLLGQRGACLVARDHLDAGCFGEGGVDVVERVLQRRCGKNRDLLLRDQRLRSAGECDADKGKTD